MGPAGEDGGVSKGEYDPLNCERDMCVKNEFSTEGAEDAGEGGGTGETGKTGVAGDMGGGHGSAACADHMAGN